MLPILIGAGLGVAKSELVDRPKAERDRKMQAELARYSPWTGMQANPGAIKGANPFDSALQGGLTGAMMSQMMGGGEAAAGAAGAAEGGASAGAAGAGMANPDAGSMMGGQSLYQQSLSQKYPWLEMK